MQEFRNDFLQDHAAALTYYGILSIFPGILVLVSLLGLVGTSATQPLINSLANAVPANVRDIFLAAATHLQGSHATAGILAIVGIAVGLWSASGYIAAFMRVSNAIYDVPVTSSSKVATNPASQAGRNAPGLVLIAGRKEGVSRCGLVGRNERSVRSRGKLSRLQSS